MVAPIEISNPPPQKSEIFIIEMSEKTTSWYNLLKKFKRTPNTITNERYGEKTQNVAK